VKIGTLAKEWYSSHQIIHHQLRCHLLEYPAHCRKRSEKETTDFAKKKKKKKKKRKKKEK
jgi:hypothetical protein